MDDNNYIYIFSILALILNIELHYYVWRRMIRDSKVPLPWKRIFGGLILFFAIILPLSLILGRQYISEITRYFLFVPYLWMGTLCYLTMMLLLVDLPRLFIFLGKKILRKSDLLELDESRRVFINRSLAGSISLISLGATGLGVSNVSSGPYVKRVDIDLLKFPKSMDGFKIVQISDLHIGPILKRDWLSMVIDQVEKLQPDLIAITGDLVESYLKYLKKDLEPLSRLKAKYGVYFVTGNHEYFYDYDNLIQELGIYGIRVLRNEGVEVGDSDQTFYILGVDDYSAARFSSTHGQDVEKAVGYRNENEKESILLAHQPKAVFEASKLDVGLVLAGHTHGGQIWPWGYFVYLQQPYLRGLHIIGERTQLYINEGTGFWGPPMRVGTREEITLITLRHG